MYTQTTITGKPKVSLAEQQVRARAKATAERSDYSFKLGNITIREKGSAQARRIGTVEVRNLKSGACYTVAFLPKSKPLCNCPAALKMAGTSYSCKHTVMAREFVGMTSHFEEEGPAGEEREEEPKPASPEVRARIGNPLLDTKIVQEQDGRFYVHRIYGDGRYGFERQLSALNPGRESCEECRKDLALLRKIRWDAAKKSLSDL